MDLDDGVSMRDIPDENTHPLVGKTFVIDALEVPQKRQRNSRQAA